MHMDIGQIATYRTLMSDASSVRIFDRTTPPHIATLIIMAAMSALSMNIFLPSLPQMTVYFETEYRVMQLSVALYLATNAALQLVIGPISDKLGRRPVVLTGLAIFTLASLACIFAPNVTVFLVFRMCQTIVAVGMVLSRAIVRDIHPQDKAASMIGYVTAGMSLAPMFSPAIGGVLDAAFGWQGSFWALTLAGLAVFWLCWADQGETVQVHGKSMGAQFREYPELFRSPRFWGYSVACAATSGAFFSYLGGAPFVGSEIFGLTPTQLGVYFGAPAVGYLVGNVLTGRYAERMGINWMILWGCVICATALLALLGVFMLGLGSALVFFGSMTFVGLGNGMSIPNAMAGMLSVRPHLAGTASGLGGALMIGGGAALSATAGWLLTPDSGALPLLLLMLGSAVLAVLATVAVILRERQLGI